MKSILKGLNYIFALLLICIAIFLAYIAIPVFGNKALIVRSGSMQPTIKTGDLAVVHVENGIESPTTAQINKYKEGEIIAFKAEQNPDVLTTHRVTAVQLKDGQIFYQTKGDANQISDKQLVAQKFVIGKSTFTVPAIGKLFAFAKTKQGFALLVLIPALLVILTESVNLAKELLKIIRARRMLQADPLSDIEKGNLLGPIGLRVLMPFVVSIMFFHNSFAFFSDTASSTNNIFSAAVSFPHIVINEVYHSVANDHKGVGAESNYEWVEIYNPTNNTVSLTGWTISDGNSTDTLPGTINIPALSFAIISPLSEANVRSVSGGNWPGIPIGTLFIDLADASIGSGFNNGGDWVILRNNSVVIIDQLSYGSDAAILNPAAPNVATGHSLERNPLGLDNNLGSDFVDRNPPTPGI